LSINLPSSSPHGRNFSQEHSQSIHNDLYTFHHSFLRHRHISSFRKSTVFLPCYSKKTALWPKRLAISLIILRSSLFSRMHVADNDNKYNLCPPQIVARKHLHDSSNLTSSLLLSLLKVWLRSFPNVYQTTRKVYINLRYIAFFVNITVRARNANRRFNDKSGSDSEHILSASHCPYQAVGPPDQRPTILKHSSKRRL